MMIASVDVDALGVIVVVVVAVFIGLYDNIRCIIGFIVFIGSCCCC
jgi:hypothetical protein